MDIQEFNRTVIEEFRANGGKVGGQMEGMPLLLLHTVGAKSGAARVNPLAYLADGSRYVIIASFAGNAHHPPWYHNLIAQPDVTIEVGDETFEAHATVLGEPMRSDLYAKMEQQLPVFTEYREKTSRTIPVIALSRR